MSLDYQENTSGSILQPEDIMESNSSESSKNSNSFENSLLLSSTNRNIRGSLSDQNLKLEIPNREIRPKSKSRRLGLAQNRSNSQNLFASPRKSSLIQDIINDTQHPNSPISASNSNQNLFKTVKFDSDYLDSEGNVKKIINRGAQHIGQHLRLQMIGTQRIYEIKSQIEKLTANIEQLETRTKYQQFVNDTQEAKLRRNMANFQNDYVSIMTKSENEIYQLGRENKRLMKKIRQTNNKIKKTEKQIQKYNSIIEKHQSREKDLGKKEALFERPTSDLPNAIAVENVIQNRENRLAKFTLDIDNIKAQISTINENMKFYKKQQQATLEKKEKIDQEVQNAHQRKMEAQEDNEHDIEEIRANIQKAINDHTGIDQNMDQLHNDQMKISESITKTTKEYMKLDLKLQNIERAIIVASSNPEKINLDMEDKETDRFIKKYKKKIRAFDKDIAQRGKEATDKIMKIREQKKEVKNQMIKTQKNIKKYKGMIQDRENRILKVNQEIREVDLMGEEEEMNNIPDNNEEESVNNANSDPNSVNKLMCDLYIDPNCGIRSAGQVIAMESIRKEESLKSEIKNLQRKAAFVQNQIEQQTGKNGLLFAKIRAYQIKLQNIAENENKRLGKMRPRIGRKDLTELKDLVASLTDKRKERKQTISEKKEQITSKRRYLYKIEALLKKNTEKPKENNNIESTFKQLDEFSIKLDLELIKWQTLRKGEDEYLLNRWNLLLPDVK